MEPKRTTPIAAPSPRPRQSGKSSAGVAIVVAIIAVACGIGVTWFVAQRGRSAEAAASNANAAPKYVVPLEGFTVNLADPEETHFFRVTINLGLGRLPEGTDAEKGVTALPIARIRDSILQQLTVCKADVLLTPDGKAQLKKNILAGLHQSVPEIDVRDIYFTEFLVQR